MCLTSDAFCACAVFSFLATWIMAAKVEQRVRAGVNSMAQLAWHMHNSWDTSEDLGSRAYTASATDGTDYSELMV